MTTAQKLTAPPLDPDEQNIPPANQPPQSGQHLLLLVLVFSQLLIWLDNSILNLALKTLADPAKGLGATPSQLQWAISSYSLIFAAMLFTGGALSDRFGHRAILVTGVLIFGGSSAWAAYAGSADQLILARGCMGLGSALVMPATLSIITHAFAVEHRARAIALWSGSAGIAIVVGPLVSGVLLDHYWWGSIFLINLPIVGLALVGIAIFVPEFRNALHRPFDWLGVALSVAGLLSLVFGVIRGGQLGSWGRPDVSGPLVAGCVGLVAFVMVEQRTAAPSFEIALFRVPRFTGGSVSVMFVFFGLTGAQLYSTFYMQGVLRMSPLATGVALLPVAIGVFVGTLLSRALVSFFTLRSVVAGALLTAAGTFAGYLLFDQQTSTVWLEALLFLQGASMGLAIAPTTAAVMAAVPDDLSGVGSALNTSMRQIGGVFGVAVLGSILSMCYRARVDPLLVGVPEPARRTARVSAEATRSVAMSLGRPALVEVADESFVHAMHVAAAWGGFISLLAVLAVVVFFRPVSGRHLRANKRGGDRTKKVLVPRDKARTHPKNASAKPDVHGWVSLLADRGTFVPSGANDRQRCLVGTAAIAGHPIVLSVVRPALTPADPCSPVHQALALAEEQGLPLVHVSLRGDQPPCLSSHRDARYVLTLGLSDE